MPRVMGGGNNVCLLEGIFDYGCMFVFDAEFFSGEDGQGSITVLYVGQCGDAVP